MKNKIYIETSVVSHYAAKRSENIRILAHQLITEELWSQLPKFDVYISDIVIDEVSKGSANQSEARLIAIKDFNVIEQNSDVSNLANVLLSKKGCLNSV